MKVAVVYNRDSKNVINLFGQPNLEKIGLKSIKRIVDSLKEGGHQAVALEGDKDLVDRLEEFMPRVLRGERPGMVFNISYGIQGQARYTHVPSILEMVGIPYVGSGPLAHSIALDKVIAKMILIQNGLPTPGFAVLESPGFPAPDLAYPLIVKPKNEAVSFGLRVVRNEEELREAAGVIFKKFRQDVLVEQYIDGREINVGLLGNGPPEALPPCELSFGTSGEKIYSYEDKTGKSGREIELLCPAPVSRELTAKAQSLAKKAFSAIGCYDCARVDMRLDQKNNLYILEINSLPSLGPRGSYVMAARTVGMDFTRLVNRLIEIASARYFGTPSPPKVSRQTRDPETGIFTFLTERRDLMERHLREWVKTSSRTTDPIGLGRISRGCQRLLTELMMKPVPDLSDSRSVYTWETKKGMKDGTLLVWHIDVPITREMPVEGFRREPEWLAGEGIGTSRAPMVAAEFALRALRHIRMLRSRRIGVLYYLDEGRDCRYSSEIIRKAMTAAKRVIVLRPGGIGNTIYSRRRGQRRYQLLIQDDPIRPGRAMKRPETMVWLSGKLVEISTLSSRKEKLSVSIKSLRTQAFPMLLPHQANVTILVTYGDAASADRAARAITKILGKDGPKWELELVSDRPPVRERRANKRFLKELLAVAEQWDIPLKNDSSVWPSVAGLAPQSTAVICGFGPIAQNLYTPGEAIQRISLMQRTLLLAQYLLTADRNVK